MTLAVCLVSDVQRSFRPLPMTLTCAQDPEVVSGRGVRAQVMVTREAVLKGTAQARALEKALLQAYKLLHAINFCRKRLPLPRSRLRTQGAPPTLVRCLHLSSRREQMAMADTHSSLAREVR